VNVKSFLKYIGYTLPVGMEIRTETVNDIDAIRLVNVAAFGRNSEADLVDRLRDSVTSKLSFVATVSNVVVGHIFFSPVTLVDCLEIFKNDNENDYTFLGLAPLAVLPKFQRQGIGSLLIQHGLNVCRQNGCLAVFVLGHSNYYPKFGFIPACEKNFRCEYNVPDDKFMIAELQTDSCHAFSGLVKYRPEFQHL
jgi:putative acetyltransferase